MVVRVATLVVALMLVLGVRGRVARADNIDDLMKQLDDDSAKVRLAAVTALRKAGDPKAIISLAKHVNEDTEDDADVRASAAAGLGQLVTSTTKSSFKNLAVKNLQKAASADSSKSVKAEATKALTKINGASATTANTSTASASTSASGGIYINVGPMSSKTTATAAQNTMYRGVMVKTATKTVGKKAPHAVTTWPGGKEPTNAQLSAKSMMGFYIDGTLNTLTVQKDGADATVSCKVSMLLADFPNKSVFGLLSGGAGVTGGSSQKDIDQSASDCVDAVVESLVADKIMPTVKSKCGCTP